MEIYGLSGWVYSTQECSQGVFIYWGTKQAVEFPQVG